MNISNEDKYWIGGGVLMAIAGGFMWWKKTQKAKEATTNDQPDTDYKLEPSGNTNPVKGNTKPPKGATPSYTPVRQAGSNTADSFRYKTGQIVMAKEPMGLQTYETFQKADKSWGAKLKDGLAVKKAKITDGDKLGKIIWAGITEQGKTRYVVERDGNLIKTYHWILGNDGIKVISSDTSTAKLLDMNRVLSYGDRGEEVEKLQELLGFVSKRIAQVNKKEKLNVLDGDFGPATEKALYESKGVRAIALKNF